MRLFQQKYFSSYSHFLWLNGNDHSSGYVAIGSKDLLSIQDSLGAFDQIQRFQSKHKNDFCFGFLSYDLKNDIEQLHSNNKDGLSFPSAVFFVPETILKIENGEVFLLSGSEEDKVAFEQLLLATKKSGFYPDNATPMKSRISKEEYLKKVKKLQSHIHLGDIYEINFCYEFFANNAVVEPWPLYNKLNALSQAPFSCFGKFEDQYIISASPERFVKKEASKIISQPIKGTIKRGRDHAEDNDNIERLRNDPKERSENIMIVDLVRNDLSKIAKRGSVSVEELCGIYTFDTLHQMISTVTAEVDTEKFDSVDVIKALFPMGSMTGAPKIRAMQLIESFEESQRGLYSGAVGYFDPNGDFDFNVVIRSFLYDQRSKYLSFSVGSAITERSDPDFEYNETLLKAQALLKAVE